MTSDPRLSADGALGVDRRPADALADPSRSGGDFEDRFDAVASALQAPGAPYEVGLVDIGGAPMRVFLRSVPSLREIWRDTRRFGSQDYLIFGGDRFTYDEAHRITASVGAWLDSQGIGAGDRVAIAMRNYPEWMLIYWACVSIGVTVVGLNAWWLAEELTLALEDCQPRAVFCDAERLERIAPWRSRNGACAVVAVRATVSGTTPWSEVIARQAHMPEVEVDPQTDACIFFTSGTTGRSKGARLTHRNCVNSLMNLRFFLEASDRVRRGGQADGLGGAPLRVLVTTPLFHVTANNGAVQPVASLGGTAVLMYKWDPAEALRLIEAEKITTVVGVPIMLRETLQHPDAGHRDLSSLTSLSGGGAPMPPNMAEWLGEGADAPQLGAGFGMTETTGTVAAISGEELRRRPESCGRLVPTFEAKLLDEDGNVLPRGAQGELCVRGPGVIPGYLGQALDYAGPSDEGWLRTGDIARFDDEGYLFIVDRKKDMILRGGENVYCAEVEAALLAHPDVGEACAFAVPDDRLGEEVGAAVFPRSGAVISPEALRDHVGGLIARYKVPRHLWITQTPLPRNASGKFLRRELKASLTRAEPERSAKPGLDGAGAKPRAPAPRAARRPSTDEGAT